MCKHCMMPYKPSCWNMLEDCKHTYTQCKISKYQKTPENKKTRSSSSSPAPPYLFPGFILNSKQPSLFFQLHADQFFHREGDFEALNYLFLGLNLVTKKKKGIGFLVCDTV